MGKTWNEIEKEAYEKGILLDGCGQTDRYYNFGAFSDFCGFDVLTEECLCGYSYSGGGGSSSAKTYDIYIGELPYSAYTTNDSINAEAVQTLSKSSETKQQLNAGVSYEFILKAFGVPGLNTTLSDTEYENAEKLHAFDYVFAAPSELGAFTFMSNGIINDSGKWISVQQTINNIQYNIFSRISYTEQRNLYDSDLTTGKDMTINYIIKL